MEVYHNYYNILIFTVLIIVILFLNIPKFFIIILLLLLALIAIVYISCLSIKDNRKYVSEQRIQNKSLTFYRVSRKIVISTILLFRK